MGLDCERGYCYGWDTHSWQLPSAAGYGVSTPAARADCGAASGAGISDFDPVTMIAGETGLCIRRGRCSGVLCNYVIGIEVFTFTTMSKMKSTESEGQGDAAAAKLIDARINELVDWRGALLARVRALIKQADAEVVEEWKWRGVPVWSHAGMICSGETYKSVVKLTFAKGAAKAGRVKLRYRQVRCGTVCLQR